MVNNTNFMFLIFISLASCFDKKSNNGEIKPLKYTKNGVEYDCNAFLKEGEIFKIECYDNKRNIILIDHYENDSLNGLSKEIFPNGQLKKEGITKNNLKVGVWKEYYPSGILKKYSYTSPETGLMTYAKNYDSLGLIQSLLYDISTKVINEGKNKLGKPIEVEIELNYSEFDSLSLLCIFDNDADTQTYEDSLYFKGNIARYSFLPSKKGHNKLHGILVEVNHAGETESKMYGGERKFEVEYYVE